MKTHSTSRYSSVESSLRRGSHAQPGLWAICSLILLLSVNPSVAEQRQAIKFSADYGFSGVDFDTGYIGRNDAIRLQVRAYGGFDGKLLHIELPAIASLDNCSLRITGSAAGGLMQTDFGLEYGVKAYFGIPEIGLDKEIDLLPLIPGLGLHSLDLRWRGQEEFTPFLFGSSAVLRDEITSEEVLDIDVAAELPIPGISAGVNLSVDASLNVKLSGQSISLSNPSTTITSENASTAFCGGTTDLSYHGQATLSDELGFSPGLYVRILGLSWEYKPVRFPISIPGLAANLPLSFTGQNVSFGTTATKQLTGISISGPPTVSQNSITSYSATALYSDGSSEPTSATWSVSSGATIDSSSGLLRAGSVAKNTVVTISASRSGKNASYPVTILGSGTGGGGDTKNLVTNGDFESGTSGWVLSPNSQISTYGNLYYSSSHYLWLGDDNGTDSAYQQISIPADAVAASLTFFYNINSSVPPAKGSLDTFSVSVRSADGSVLTSIANWSNLNGTPPGNPYYYAKTFDLTQYRGSTVRLYFESKCHLAGSETTNFRVDDVSVMLTTPKPRTPSLFGFQGPSTVVEGTPADYKAIIVYDDGTSEPANGSSWSVDGPATIVGSGAAATLYADQVNFDSGATIKINYVEGGTQYPGTFPITILNKTPAFSHLTLGGPTALNEQTTAPTPFSVAAVYSDGSSIPISEPQITWVVNPAGIGSIINGVLTVGAIDSDTIVTVRATTTVNGTPYSVDQNVRAFDIPVRITLSSLSIFGPDSLPDNGAAQFTALASFSDGSVRPVKPTTWKDDSPVAEISASGLLTVSGSVPSDTSVNITATLVYEGVPQSASQDVLIRSSQGTLVVKPDAPLVATGNQGGPFAPESKTFQISNSGAGTLDWTVTSSEPWVTLTPNSGQGGGDVVVSLNEQANALTGTPEGSGYASTLTFASGTTGTIRRQVHLTVTNAAPKHLTGASRRNDKLRFVLNGKANAKYLLEESAAFPDWALLATYTLPATGSMMIEKPIDGRPQVFYRAREESAPVLPIFSEIFDRFDSPAVGGSWVETDTNDLLSIQSNTLRLNSSIDKSAYLRADASAQLDVKISFTLNIISQNDHQVIQIGTKGGGGVDTPYRDCFGFALLPGRGVQPNDTGFQGTITPFSFELGITYQIEILIFADNSRELRIWPSTGARPSSPTVAASAQPTVLATGSKYQIGFDSGSSAPADLRIDDFQIETIGQ